MRLRQFGGALEHTVFKCLVRFLSPTDEPRVFDRNSGLGGEADNDLLVPCCEPSSLRMPEKKAADYFALSRDDGYGEMACRSEENTSELQSLMRISYAVFCLKKTNSTPTPVPSCTSRHHT